MRLRHALPVVLGISTVGQLAVTHAISDIHSSPGCTAVNAGRLDLDLHVNGVVHWGSAPVRGFAIGDIVRFKLTSTARKAGLLQIVRYEAIDPDTNASIATALTIGAGHLAEGQSVEVFDAIYAISENVSSQAFFTSSSGEGVGNIRLIVRCDPSGTQTVSGVPRTSYLRPREAERKWQPAV